MNENSSIDQGFYCAASYTRNTLIELVIATESVNSLCHTQYLPFKAEIGLSYVALKSLEL